MPQFLKDVLILVVVAGLSLIPAFFAVRLLVELGLFGNPNHAGTGYAAAFFGVPLVWIVITAWAMGAVSAWCRRHRDRRQDP